MDELRSALKVIDRELMALAINHPEVELKALGDAFADLSEYLLKSHARLDRMSTEINRLIKRQGVEK